MNDSLGDRMKRYEHAFRHVLPPRMPVVIRVDGKAFHTWTKRCERPFDDDLIAAMDRVALALCEQVQTTVLAYVQSDEVSMVLHGYRRHASQPWFGNELQKLCSVSASIATAAMNETPPVRTSGPAHFDARAFVLPECEVENYLIWRQQDAKRNSVQMLARSLFSAKECHRKSCDELKVMCQEAGHGWRDLDWGKRYGRVIMKGDDERRSWGPPNSVWWFNSDYGRRVVRRLLACEDA